MSHHDLEHSTPYEHAIAILADAGFEGMAEAITVLMNELMLIERQNYMDAPPHARSETRRARANGFKPKSFKTRVGALDLRIPQVRDRAEGVEPFYPKALERGERSERALCLAVAEMYVQGVSTRKVTEITKQLCGLDVTSAQVSRAAKALDEELEAWRNRELGEVRYLFFDATYVKVRRDGSVQDSAVFLAKAVLPDGRRSLVGVSVGHAEAEVQWRDFLASLQDRGLHGVRLICSDDHAGLRAAIKARFPGVIWQRCQVHLQRNAAGYVSRLERREEVASDIRRVFNSETEGEAQERIRDIVKKWSKSEPRLAAWMETNLIEGLGILAVPLAHRRKLRTTNGVERLNLEIKRRTRVATMFPNDESLLRLVSAVLMEQTEEWETGRRYLNMT